MDILEKLLKILEIVIDWLKFAEAKNAVLLAFSGAGVTAIITYISAASNIPKSLILSLPASTFILSISSLVCLFSFLPKTNLEHIVWMQGKPSKNFKTLQNNTDNLYYYGHLMKYKNIELLDAMNQLYCDNKISQPYKKEYLDIATQIIINSEIAFLKFRFFTFSLWILIFSILIIPVSVLLNLIIFRII
ncbi:hypothetical protein H6G54_08365 [Anabaena cylindrica FACHB-243]|uniref:Pycsar effector protein domain-containing protein n=1 Tax=Anabaena cylindrica (strain ATCC 27899 / PCC 7122) TaxID=272123 RepID=K9ZLX2_ANACC|nr:MULTISPECIES: hypothetical protein [Anabaena]AFZ60228.1 hypothetical protein Anacy_4885 [Anabaena cylindrica PCC 7122]MBD2417719.1 hypothetical protein [Anabaena cylindrica FACHB-243]MBY5281296.1 hypothetical protein [Anabaena sp. CCAP 1446/1C]MBY5306891.1 hypothetical protein [Anabaena sp. CCAP 1446/1C]MCM2404634.1 hypothetical protein [Anabaena sp. CCAP 1446/1C]